MSHTTTVKALFKSPTAFEKACRKLSLEHRVGQTLNGRLATFPVKLYQNHEDAWGCVTLPGWKYPIAMREDGKVAMDNFQGRWGDMAEYDKFVHAYSVEASIEAAEAQGFTVTGVTADATTGNTVIEVQAY